MSEQAKRAEEARAVWEQACGRMLDELAVGDILAALAPEAQGREVGRG